jgi:alpha-D-xyloside xylohydrolase
MTIIDLSGEIPADGFDLLLQAWRDRQWTPRPGSLDVDGWTSAAVTVAGHDGWLLRRELGSDSLYGSGESFTGLDLRGRERALINRETNGAGRVDLAYLNVPFLWSNAGWALLIDTGAPVLMDLSRDATVLVVDPQPRVRTFAGTPREILAQYAEATGKVPDDWPDWAFGTWMSRATYLDADEMQDVVSGLHAADCPVDVIHIDAWMTGNVFREFTTNWQVDRQRFPVGWADRLRAQGVRVSMWLNPFIKADTDLARQLHGEGLLLRTAAGDPATTCDRDYRNLVDFTNPAAVTWWQTMIEALIASDSPDALKLDFAEEVPPDAVCHDGRPALLIRNSYAAIYQRVTREVAQLPFFCRSGSTGSQVAPCHWVGDTPATWDGLAGALAACLSLSASGFGLVTSDAGGFHACGSSRIPATLLDGGDAEFTADVEPELFGRWAQFAALSPVARFHGVGLREPTAYPSPWREAAIEALRMRRTLLPHLKRALAQSHEVGLPVMRPMVLMTDDPHGRAADEQYFLGDEILVAPILARGGHARVWLPEGSWQPLVGTPAVTGRSGWVEVQCGPGDFPAWHLAG